MTITNAEHVKDYKIKLTFFDGNSKVIDFEEKLNARKIYRLYLTMKKILKFKIDHNALRWPGNVLVFIITSLLKYNCIILFGFPTSKTPNTLPYP